MKEGIFRKNGEIVTRAIAGETFLVPIRGRLADMQRIFSLNATGEFIWQELDGKRDLQEIIGEIQSAFEVTREEADADAREFISALLEEGLVAGVE
jgi:hypothetical protein